MPQILSNFDPHFILYGQMMASWSLQGTPCTSAELPNSWSQHLEAFKPAMSYRSVELWTLVGQVPPESNKPKHTKTTSVPHSNKNIKNMPLQIPGYVSHKPPRQSDPGVPNTPAIQEEVASASRSAAARRMSAPSIKNCSINLVLLLCCATKLVRKN